MPDNDTTKIGFFVHRKGFTAMTLAEVLITLGIIGVLAAMTIPVLARNIQSKELESAFKKTYSSLSQAVPTIKANTGVSDLYGSYVLYNPSLGGYYMTNEWLKEFYKVMPYVKVLSGDELVTYWNYTKTAKAQSKSGVYAVPNIDHVLKDGSIMTTVIGSWGYVGMNISFYVDTNGVKKPNRFGYDVFMFYVGQKNIIEGYKSDGSVYTAQELANNPSLDFTGFPCSKNSLSPLNGMGCAAYAINNQCPDDASKTYWECLP